MWNIEYKFNNIQQMHGISQMLYKNIDQVYDADTYFQQMVTAKHLTVQQVLHCISKCPSLKQDSDLLKLLFYKKKQVIQDLIDWMFQPEKIINKRFPNQKKGFIDSQKNKEFRQVPFLCKKWVKDNETFYQTMVQAAVNNQIPIERWFFFLYDQNSCFIQSPTFITSMGYFSQVMIPFINAIELSFVRESITSILNVQANQSKRASLMSSISFISLQQSKYKSKKEEIVLFGIFKEYLLDKLIQCSCFDGIFKFVHVLCLRSLQQCQREVANVKIILVRLFNHFDVLVKKSYAKNQFENWLQNLIGLLKQLQNNMKTDSEKAMDQSNLSAKFIDFILNSMYFNDILDQEQERKMFSSAYNHLEKDRDMKEMLKRSQGISQFIGRMKKRQSQNDRVEQYEIRLMLESLAYIIKLSEKVVCPSINNSLRETFDKVPFLLKLVKQRTTRKVMPFSSGQNATKITILKHNCLKMLLQTISIFCRFHQISQFKPKLNIKKEQIYKIVQRYLSENRWNNIAHHTLQKITQVLNSVHCKLQKAQIVNNEFLSYLIQSFMNDQYVYLQTLHFTSQGNLHSIYIISKQTARYLNTNKKLLPSLKEFEPWKKFLTNNLNKFQENLTKYNIPVSNEMIESMRKDSQNQSIAIDQVDTIKKLLEDVQQQLSWQNKLEKRRLGMMLRSYAPISHSRNVMKKYSVIEKMITKMQTSQVLEGSNSSYDSMHNFLASSQHQMSSLSTSDLKGSLPVSPPTLAYSAKKSPEGKISMEYKMRQHGKKLFQSQIIIPKVQQEKYQFQSENTIKSKDEDQKGGTSTTKNH